MGSGVAVAAAGSAAHRKEELKAGEAGSQEDSPIKVHSRWDLTHTTYWVDLDDLFRAQKTKKMLELLKRMYEEQDPMRRPPQQTD